ncbi:MAG: hypothetical protein BWX81_00824 [Spirochaetes bacterium ADurb.Bin110]|nr:MAG: hypothetical protein BWX81_00824 [Spirochaetes bacterium ADurb.Bin110]
MNRSEGDRNLLKKILVEATAMQESIVDTRRTWNDSI